MPSILRHRPEQLNASPFGPFSFFLNYGYVPGLNPQYSCVQLPERMLNKNSVLLVLEVLEDCVTAASRVLDVGCGRGGTLFVITQFFQCPIASMSEDVRRMVGQNVQRLRIAAGLTQAQLAEQMGVDRAYVSGLELDRLRRARWRNRQP